MIDRYGYPVARNYVYRGTGRDTLTEGLTDGWEPPAPDKPRRRRKRSQPVRVHYDVGGGSRCGWCTPGIPASLTVNRAQVTCERCITYLHIGSTS